MGETNGNASAVSETSYSRRGYGIEHHCSHIKAQQRATHQVTLPTISVSYTHFIGGILWHRYVTTTQGDRVDTRDKSSSVYLHGPVVGSE